MILTVEAHHVFLFKVNYTCSVCYITMAIKILAVCELNILIHHV